MPIISRATVEQSTKLAVYLHSQGLSPEQSVQWLKSKHYAIRDTRFDVVKVASVIAGINIGMALPRPRKSKAKA